MKKILISLAGVVAIAICAGCLFGFASNRFDKRIKGSGKLITRTVEVGAFDAVRASSTASVALVAGSGPVTVQADDNIMDRVKVTVEEGTLVIGMTQGSYSNITLEVTVPTDGKLTALRASGASKIVCEPVLTADDIDLKASGASKLVAIVRCNECEIDASGASKVEIGGDMSCCEAEATGASRLKLVIKAGTCKLRASGASKMEVQGSAASSSIEVSGASSLTADEFVTETCDVDASGASKASVNCTAKLVANASSASKIVYTDGANLNKVISKSSAGSVRER